MKFNYSTVEELSQLIGEVSIKIRETRYQGSVDTDMLDELIEKLDELVNLKSKLADFDELKSDIEWLKEYYKEESWSDTTRWLKNIDNTLQKTFSCYIDKVKNTKEE